MLPAIVRAAGREGDASPVQNGDIAVPDFEPLYPDSDCGAMSGTWRNSLQSLAWFMRYWRDNFLRRLRSQPYLFNWQR
ncbi:Sensor kinase protein RcsC [Raoultella terrigena]|uniref:Sensor kinase protein RcsC n=1 Tax=Raoultella terrigena TaxID=577 RepID=A0A4U9D2X8_RAOTE|nr:Sensor kinase protein RcsC [Raoultella terrigena]